jgi:exopolyphosphatase / guanosine-5'-triphosphate,3'-diphosphate pyrophosphatase
MTNRVAIIDLGTNTFHLLVAEKQGSEYVIIHRDREAVKIGMGGINDGVITESGIARALKTLKGFSTYLKENSITHVLAFGTSALRNAKNGKEVAHRIYIETGIRVNIISGDEEAMYIYKGVRWAVKMKEHTSLIVDIGGGSVEFIIGNDKEVFWKQSFEVGGQRLLEKFQKHDPILEEEKEALHHHFDEILKPLVAAMEKYKPMVMVGSSGTFDTLSDIYCIREHIPKGEHDPETPLTKSAFFEIYNEFLIKNRAERMRIEGMIEMRVDMIVVACCLIEWLLISDNDFYHIRVSSYSLKEGVLASLVE